jgi:hypothetical protein
MLKTALGEGTLAIDTLLGAGSLAYKLSQLRDALCLAYTFLDDDKMGRDSAERAERDGLLTQADLSYSVCPGMNEAEFEDMCDSSSYAQMVKNVYRVDLDVPAFRTKEKWSKRVRNVFRQQGKQWNERIEADLKTRIASLIAADPASALNEHKRSAYDALVVALEEKLNEISSLRG